MSANLRTRIERLEKAVGADMGRLPTLLIRYEDHRTGKPPIIYRGYPGGGMVLLDADGNEVGSPA